ncbi:MAG: hypothetical protein ABEK59_11620 [Halobacteria archaeon]
MFRKVRKTLWPRFDLLLGRMGGYATGKVSNDGYLGTVDMNLKEIEHVLRDIGFSYEYIASLKDRICPQGGEIETGSWVLRTDDLKPYQLHIHLFEHPGDGVDIYCHLEYNWKSFPLKHYRRENVDVDLGVEITKSLLDSQNIEIAEEKIENRCGV